MRRLFYSILFSLIFALSLVVFNWTVYAQSVDDLSKQLQDKEIQIQQLQSQLQTSRKEEKTLKSQLDIIDGQTKITQLKIDQTNLQIEKLKREITDLSGRIDRLSTTVDSISQVLLDRIVKTYKYGDVGMVDLLFSSHNFSETLERLKYIQVAQANDKKVLYQLQATKAAYHDQKTDKQTRQVEAEKLSKDLAAYQKQLDQQKKDKAELLRLTQNDESKYQNLINQLQAEVSSISQAISNIGAKIGPVNKGDVVAGMGSTGCSTGPHLHFEVYENAKVEGGRIVGNRTNPHNYLDNGKIGSPLQGYPPGDTVITTEYGEVYQIFGFPTAHTGLDIAPKGGGGLGRAIYASEKGVAYVTSASCGYNIVGGSSVGKGVIIDHENGIVTLYWHVL